ncbi:O-antigen ligase family protein [Aeromonas veronii]|uniref:O-antigen ligase family protein n=1 Tax=Aeromonas veronii TaxID=654 RepID=UPI00191D410A|nr:O-antigen ligase family protein [Aeromonas veronii]
MVILNGNIKNKIILIFFSFYSFFDFVNGFLYFSGYNYPISIVYKSILMLLMLLSLARVGSYAIIFIISSILLLGYTYRISQSGGQGGDIQILVRYVFFVVSYLYFSHATFYSKDISFFKIMIASNVFVILSNIYSGLLGIGYSTYGSHPLSINSGFGFKGFFIAGNELAPTLIFFTCLFLIFFNYRSAFLKRQFVYFIFFFASMLLGTKSAILGMFIVLTFIEIKFYDKFNYLIKTGFIIILISYVSYSSVLYYQSGGLDAFIERYSWIIQDKGIVDFIFSGRLSFLSDVYSLWSYDISILRVIFGIDYGYTDSVLAKPMVEIDLFDIFFLHGLSALLFVFIFYISMFLLFIKSGGGALAAYISLLLLNVLLFMSFFSGHILNSGMLLPLLPMVLVFTKRSFNENLVSKY